MHIIPSVVVCIVIAFIELDAINPTKRPTSKPTGKPSRKPSYLPSTKPTRTPTKLPSLQPTTEPSSQPTAQPTSQPSSQPTSQPSSHPTSQPSYATSVSILPSSLSTTATPILLVSHFKNSQEKLSGGQIAGIVVAGVALLIIGMFVLYHGNNKQIIFDDITVEFQEENSNDTVAHEVEEYNPMI